MTSVIVLSRFPEIFAGFRDSVDRDAPEVPKLVLWDCEAPMPPPIGDGAWRQKQSGGPFQIAKNANAAWETFEDDLIYAGDDTRIIEPNTIKRLREVAYSERHIGIVSTTIKGHKRPATLPPVMAYEQFVPFVFVFIKRELINKIGYLDERFEGYGVEDIDYCVRARMAGFDVGRAYGITIQHGVEGKPHMSTFLRVKTHQQIAAEDDANWARFAEKYGLPNDRRRIWEFVRNLK